MRAAVVGAGYISRHHIRALQSLPNVDLVAICDRSPAVAQSVAAQFEIENWFTDHRAMFDSTKPTVTHVTTPIGTHFAIASDAIRSGSHVFVEKPITHNYQDWELLRQEAVRAQRLVVEDQNYRFNRPFQLLLDSLEDGSFGEIVHVDVTFCLNLEGSVFEDPNLRHETLDMPGGPIIDFLPHLAYLAQSLIGTHHSVATIWNKRNPSVNVPYDEFRGLIEGRHATASLSFSGSSQPDGFWVTAYGTRMQTRINLLEDRMTSVRLRSGPSPLMHLFNGLSEGKATRQCARNSLLRKLSGGPASYEGLFELIRRFYTSVEKRIDPPVSLSQIDETQRLVRDLTQDMPF